VAAKFGSSPRFDLPFWAASVAFLAWSDLKNWDLAVTERHPKCLARQTWCPSPDSPTQVV